MIPATRREYAKAFNVSLAEYATEAHRPVTFMLLFYRAECGLKALLCDARRLSARPAMNDQGCLRTHNLGEIVRELKLPANAQPSGSPPTFRLRREKTDIKAWPSYSAENAHAVWRYGIEMEAADQGKLITWLNHAVTYVQGKI